MAEIFASGSLPIIHTVMFFLILLEILNSVGKCIFSDYNNIIIKNMNGSKQKIKEFFNNKLKGFHGEEIPLITIFNAYRYLNYIKVISYIIILSSLLFVFPLQLLHFFKIEIFNDNLNVSATIENLWFIVFVLDVILIFTRIVTKPCFILHALHPNYKNIPTALIIIYLYVIKN